MRRTLTVILASDVAGYSRLVAEHEEDTIQRFRQAAVLFSDLVKKHQGTIFNTAGDAILARFDSAVDATRCAIDIQDANNSRNGQVADDKKLLFRIGIAIGDVLVAEDGDLLGDAVNVAARLENLADAGGICISDDVRAHVLNKIRINVVDLGQQSLRNIPRAIRVYKLLPGRAGPLQAAGAVIGGQRPLVRLASGLGLVAAIVAGVLGWNIYGPSADLGDVDLPFEASKIPMVTDRQRETLAGYAHDPNFKALAISRENYAVSVGDPDVASARREAMGRCRQKDQKGYCRIYAVGNKVVWSKPLLPLPADMRTEPIELPFAPAHRELITWANMTQKGAEDYANGKGHRAMALARDTYWVTVNRSNQAEAARLATERCSDRSQSMCLLVSVDGFLTVNFPRSYKLTEPFTLAGERDMTDTDRERIARIYAAKDWRALARGNSKAWYAVAGKASETDAVNDVMKDCQQSESTKCSLHAIGNFRVGDKIP
jgi:adenylate cyclase